MKDLRTNPSGKYNGKEMEYVLELLDTENAGNKKKAWTQRLEEKFKEMFNVRYAIACNSGTSGLHAAVIAAGVGPGDEVISPPITVVMDALATIHAGAKPVFADVDPDTWIMDVKDIERKITSKTKAIIAVSICGLPVDMGPLMELAENKGIIVIDDSAQTLFGKCKGKMAGTLAHFGVFSFENAKHITCCTEGGMIVTNDENLAVRARKFAGIGYKHLTADAGRTSLTISTVQDPNYERFDAIGLNYRMPEICAAVGLAQLERAEFLVSRRQKIAEMFNEAIDGCEWMVKQKVPEGIEHSYYTYSVKYFGKEKFGVSWKEFYNKYKEMGGDGFYGMPRIPYTEPVLKNYKDIDGNLVRWSCPIAEGIQPKLMCFKTNYRDLNIARKKIDILGELIKRIDKTGKC